MNNAKDMTAGPVLQLHAGPNVHIATPYVQDETQSASVLYGMHRMPAGARVTGGKLLIQGVTGGTIRVLDSLGNVYLHSSTPTTQVAMEFNGPGLGTRLTSSAHLMIENHGESALQAGADSCTYSTITEFLSDMDGD